MNLLKKEIRTKQDIINYIDLLHLKNMLYHFDEDADQILCHKSNFSVRAFTDEECIYLDKRREEMLCLDYDFVFDYLIHIYDIEDLVNY